MIRKTLRLAPVIRCLGIAFVLLMLALYLLDPVVGLSKENVIDIIRAYILLASAALVVVQLRVNLSDGRRRAATDFMFREVSQILGPMEQTLLTKLRKPNIHFAESESFEQACGAITNEDERRCFQRLVLDILNFYERMAIGIFKESLDEDICYDDRGFVLMNLFSWCNSFVTRLQTTEDKRAYSNLARLVERWILRYLKQSEMIEDADRWRELREEKIRKMRSGRRRLALAVLRREYEKRRSDAEIVLQEDMP